MMLRLCSFHALFQAGFPPKWMEIFAVVRRNKLNKLCSFVNSCINHISVNILDFAVFTN